MMMTDEKRSCMRMLIEKKVSLLGILGLVYLETRNLKLVLHQAHLMNLH